MTFIKLHPDVKTDLNNSSEVALIANGSFIGTATDISPYLQIIVNVYGLPANAKGSLFTEFSPNGTVWTTSTPLLIRNPSGVIPIPLIHVHKYFRVRYLNDGGAAAITALSLSELPSTPIAQTTFILITYLSPFATKELVRTIDQTLSPSDPVNLNRCIMVEKDSDGNYINRLNPTCLHYYNADVDETVLLKSGPGRLKKIIFTNPSGGDITVYDSLTGTGAIITKVTLSNNQIPFSINYDIDFMTGLTFLSAGNIGDFTITFE